MNKITSVVKWIVLSLVVSTFWRTSFLFSATQGEVTVTGQALRGDPNASNKFKEYRTVPDGIYLEGLLLKSENEETHCYLKIKGEKFGLDDQNFSIESGKMGMLKMGLRYDQTPHLFATTAKSLFVDNGSGVLGLSNQIQTALQTSTNNAAASFSDVPYIPLQVRRDNLSAYVQAMSLDGFSVNVSASQENKNGSRPLGITFGHGSLVEVAEPIQYKTQEVSTLVEMNRPGFNARLGVNSSFFTNEIDAVTVDYPWRATPSAITASGSSTPDKGSFGLPPDNQSHRFSFQTGINLPFWNSRWNSSVSYGWTLQDDKFLPMTVNSAIIARAAALGISLEAPQSSLGGKVKTWNASSILSLNPTKALSVKGKFSFYDYKNQTPELLFAQYVAYDTSLSTATPKAGFKESTQRKSLAVGYSKLNAGTDFSYQLLQNLSATLGYSWERISREHRETGQTDEHGLSLSFDYMPSHSVSFRPSFFRSNRYYDSYNAETVAEEMFPLTEGVNVLGQLPLLRKTDQAQRLRDLIGIKTSVDPFDSLSIEAEYSYRLDDYYGSQYGTLKEFNHSYGLEVFYRPSDAVSIFVDYSREENTFDTRSRYRESGNATRVPFDRDTSDWVGRIEDETNTYGVGANADVVKNKLFWDVKYSLSRSKGETYASNPSAIVTDATQGGGSASSQLSGATVGNFPETKTELHKITTSIKWKFVENLTAQLRYEYERYMVTDFAFDDIQVWQATWNQSVFLDAAQGNYDAHVIALSLAYKF